MKKKIWQLREAFGMTQEPLSKMIGTARPAINAIETEKNESSTCHQIRYTTNAIEGFNHPLLK